MRVMLVVVLVTNWKMISTQNALTQNSLIALRPYLKSFPSMEEVVCVVVSTNFEDEKIR